MIMWVRHAAHLPSVLTESGAPHRPPSAPPLLEDDASFTRTEAIMDAPQAWPSPTRKRVQLYLPEDVDKPAAQRTARPASTEPPKSILRSSPNSAGARRPVPSSTFIDDTHNNYGLLVCLVSRIDRCSCHQARDVQGLSRSRSWDIG